ncbi:MAG TPA: hypothetical protein VJS15_04000 [Allosphingosinicella sp.]|nr:hypothetical protein [Allosphingosinicella sp.]
MNRLVVVALALILSASPRPASGLSLPDPAANPAAMAAARAFVRTLPIRDLVGYGWIAKDQVVRSLAQEAVATRPAADVARLQGAISSRVGFRINRLLPELWPAIEEEIARAYARSLSIEALHAGAGFHRSPHGYVFALRTVQLDPVIAQTVQARLFERLTGQAEAMVAEAEEAERLRERINADRR